LALDNAIQNRIFWALNFAFRALILDPREIGDFITICRVIVARDLAQRILLGRKYSTAEIRTDLLRNF
jgi:hypothetical protein